MPESKIWVSLYICNKLQIGIGVRHGETKTKQTSTTRTCWFTFSRTPLNGWMFGGARCALRNWKSTPLEGAGVSESEQIVGELRSSMVGDSSEKSVSVPLSSTVVVAIITSFGTKRFWNQQVTSYMGQVESTSLFLINLLNLTVYVSNQRAVESNDKSEFRASLCTHWLIRTHNGGSSTLWIESFRCFRIVCCVRLERTLAHTVCEETMTFIDSVMSRIRNSNFASRRRWMLCARREPSAWPLARLIFAHSEWKRCAKITPGGLE